jgi:four helix bundle protein
VEGALESDEIAGSRKLEARRKAKMQDFRNVKAWQKAHSAALEVYRISGSFPPAERFGITIQLLRSTVSICSNIAEGCGRGSDRDFGHFLQIALGSANEAQYLLLLSRDVGFLGPSEHSRIESRLEEVRRMLITLIRRLRPPSF